MPALMWLRHDLRLEDNPALIAAAASDSLVPVFVVDPALAKGSGPNRLAFLQETLEELADQLESLGSGLLVLSGQPAEVLPALAVATGASHVHAIAGATPAGRGRDQAVLEALKAQGATLELHHGLWAIDNAAQLLTGSGRPYQVFTPFYNAWLKSPRRPVGAVPSLPPLPPLPAPYGQLRGQKAVRTSGLTPPTAASPGRLHGGRRAAMQRLEQFMAGPVQQYIQRQNSLDAGATSRLSADLHFGILSMREVEDAVPSGENPAAFRRQLAWRDFYLYVLAHFPKSRTTEFQPRYRGFDWQTDDELARAWREGQTGYPIIDAAMRQLRLEGFMPNRARLFVGSFLTKDLGLDWRLGEEHFRYWLTDGDVAANVGNWQWIASVGVDPAPVFRRLYNPTTQAERYDPSGAYIRRYVPELANVPAEWLYEPWNMPEAKQSELGCVIGRDYPEPVVDHALARAAALERYRAASDS